jgi:CRISPR-associated protein Csx17
MSLILLPGCRTEPLAGYLKGLAALRLVAQQKDADTKGWWADDCFNLESSLDPDALIDFFLREYSPTPVLAPWNGGSGFYDKDSHEGIEFILHSDDRRLADYRDAINAVLSWPEMAAARECRAGKKEFDENIKQALLMACRSRLPERALEWMDAAVTIGVETGPSYPPLLGTGGNEGRLEYTNVFMRRLKSLLAGSIAASEELLRNALFGTPASGLTIEPVGQHDPGRAGGFNQGAGIEQKKFPTNPWNFVLTMEGGIVWSSGVVRRNGINTTGLLASPFTVRPRAVGYTSSAESEQAKGRAEIWTPLWDRPASYREVRAFIGEGRAEVGNQSAADAIGFAEAASSLGVDRGISHFVRYVLVKRRGDSYIALPTGRFRVCYRAESDLLREELDPALRRFDQFLRQLGRQTPAQLKSARRQIDEAIYELLLHGGALRVKALISSIGKLEQLLARRDPTRTVPERPLGGLSSRWIAAADDGSIEVRLAAVLSSIRAAGGVGPLRANLLPIDPAKPRSWASGAAQTAWVGNSLPSKMAAIVARRVMDADRLSVEGSPFDAAAILCPEDVAAFLDGEVDEVLLEDLLFGFLWIDWRRLASHENIAQLHSRWARPLSDRPVERSWALLKLLFSPSPLRGPGGETFRVRAEPSIVPLLRAGRIGQACRIAQRRLLASGLNPLRVDFADGNDGTRIAAALLFPVRITRLMHWSLAQVGGDNVRTT